MFVFIIHTIKFTNLDWHKLVKVQSLKSWIIKHFRKLPTYPSPKPTFCPKSEISGCRFQNVLLVSVKFFPSLARAGLVEELRHLYVVVILWSGMCSLENLEVKFQSSSVRLHGLKSFHVSFEPSNPVSMLSLSIFIFLPFIHTRFVFRSLTRSL